MCRDMPSHGDRPIANWSTPMIKGRLVELLDEMGLRPFGKRPKLTDLVDFTVHDLGAASIERQLTAGFVTKKQSRAAHLLIVLSSGEPGASRDARIGETAGAGERPVGGSLVRALQDAHESPADMSVTS